MGGEGRERFPLKASRIEPLNPRSNNGPLTPALSPSPAFVGLRRGKEGEREFMERRRVFWIAPLVPLPTPWSRGEEEKACRLMRHDNARVMVELSNLCQRCTGSGADRFLLVFR